MRIAYDGASTFDAGYESKIGSVRASKSLTKRSTPRQGRLRNINESAANAPEY